MLTPQELLEIVDTMYPLLDELNGWIAKDLIRVGRWSLVILGLTLGGLMIAKILISVIVVVLNYIFSKFFIFKQK